MATLNTFATTEHEDLNVVNSAGNWSIQPQIEGVPNSADNVLHYVGKSAEEERPTGTNFDFVGVTEGSDFYHLPANQNPDALYLGFAGYGVPSTIDRYNPATESKGRITFTGRYAKVTLADVKHFNSDGTAGDGTVSLWEDGPSGPKVFMSSYNDGVVNPDGAGLDTTDGISADDALWVLSGSHNHFNFGFSKPGRYEVDLIASAYMADDGLSTPNTASFSQGAPIRLYFSVLNVGQLEFDAASYSVDEATGTASINVRRVGGSDGQITAQYATTSGGTATIASDYTATSATVTFLDQETVKTVTIPIINDTQDEPNETVNLVLSNPGPASIADYVIRPETDNRSLLGAQSTAMLTIVDNDDPANAPPTISDVTNQTTNEDTATGAIAFTVGDAETAAGSLVVTATSSNPALVPNVNIVLGGTGANRTVTLTPAANQSGATTITLTVTDGGGQTATDTFDLTVNPVNDLPTISDVVDQAANEDVSTSAIAFTIGDLETSPGALTVTATSSNTALVPNANIVLGGTGASRTVTLTPVANQFGTTTITLTVTDAGGLTATDTFVLTVNSVNDLPTISDVANVSTNEDTPTGAIPFTIGDVETVASALTVTATSSNTTLVPNANIVLGGSGANRTVTLTPAADQFGTTTITITVTDAGGLTATDTFVLNVGSDNDFPTVSDIANQTTNEDTPTGAIAFTVGDIETAAGALAVTATSSNTTLVPNANIVLGGSGANRTVSLTPAADQFGTTIITLTVTDAGGLTATDTFVLTVSAVNDQPTISDVVDQTTNENTPTGAISFTVGDVETPAGGLIVTAVSSNTTLVPTGNIALGGSGPNRTLTLTPTTHQFGTTTITLTVTDAGGLTATDTFTLTVTDVTFAPVATDDDYNVGPSSVLHGNVLFNDSDPDGDALTATIATQPASGSVIFHANGSFIYTPSGSFAGMDSFTYTVEDSTGATATGTVTISAATPQDFEAILTEGHADIGLFIAVDGEPAWDLHVHDEENDVEYHPEGALFYVGPQALTTRSNGLESSQYDFLGVAAGQPLYILPASQNPELLFLGFGAEEIEPGTLVGGTAQVNLVSVNGPGQLSLWQFTSGAPNLAFATSDGVTAADSFAALEGGHTHYNWGFTAPGRYEVTIEAVGTVVGHNEPTTATATYYFSVDSLGRIQLSADSYSVDEGGNVTLTIDRIGGSDGPLTVEHAAAGGTATPASDFAAFAGSLVFADGETSKTIVFAATADSTVEGPETTIVSLTAAPGSPVEFGTPASATITIVDGSPTADPQAVTVDEDNSLPIILTGSDPQGSTLTFEIVSGPANGTLTGASANRVYTPNANFNGTDSFTFKVNDGVSDSETVTVQITVNPVNDAPTVSNVVDQVTNEDTAPGAIPVTIGDVETAPSALTVTTTSSNIALVPNGNIVLGGSGANRTVTLTPAANQFGTTTITITVTDAGGLTATDTFVLTVNPVNDAPTISNIADLATNEDIATAAIPFTIGDVETAVGSLTVTATSSNTALVPNANIVLGGVGANRTVTLTPAGYQSGTTTITITVTDAGGLTATDTFVLTVNPVNDAPTISNVADLATNEDTATAAIPFTIGDAETAAGSLTVTTTSSNAALVPNGNIALGGSGANRTLTLTPAANQSGTTTITLTVTDAGGLTTTDTFVLTVNPVNDAPTLGAIFNPAPIAPNSGLQTIALSGIAAGGGESQTLTITATSSNPGLIPNPTVNYTSPATTGSLTFTPVAGQTGSATITVTVIDNGVTANGGVNVITRTFAVTVQVPATLDFGDAPNSYGTLLANNGPRHTVGPLFLGSAVTAEADGQPGTATGDADNGVVLPSGVLAGMTTSYTVTASQAGKLDAWIDFNRNGLFDANEKIADSIAVFAGSNSLRFNTPLNASGGGSYARFRLSTAGGLSPLGAAADGEVEDYAVQIVSSTQPGAFVIPDPENPTRGLLVINGTAGTDVIRVVNTGGANGRTMVIAPMTSSYLSLNNSTFDRVLIRGGGGIDLILFSPDFNKPATIYGDAGADVIVGGAGNDTIYGGAGIDTIRGGGGDDQIFGDGDTDFLYGEAGNDLVEGGDGSDYLYGGAGADVLIGGNGSDFIYGDTGDDLIVGAKWKYDSDPTILAVMQLIWGSPSPFTTRVNALSSRLGSSALTDDGIFDYIWTGSGQDWVHDAALRDLLLDFNYSPSNGDKRN